MSKLTFGDLHIILVSHLGQEIPAQVNNSTPLTGPPSVSAPKSDHFHRSGRGLLVAVVMSLPRQHRTHCTRL